MMQVAELIESIFGEERPALAATFEGWLRDSRRFRSWAEHYRAKIRKKLRQAENAEGLQDVLLELEIAYQLVTDERCVVGYEQTGGIGKGRGPDFTVTFRVNTIFHLEVTRIRVGDGDSVPPQAKIINAVCDKLGQMQPGAVNVIVVGASSPLPGEEMVQAMTDLRARYDRRDMAFFERRRIPDLNEFLRQFQRLSAVVYRTNDAEQPNTLWHNAMAKHRLGKEVGNLLMTL